MCLVILFFLRNFFGEFGFYLSLYGEYGICVYLFVIFINGLRLGMLIVLGVCLLLLGVVFGRLRW